MRAADFEQVAEQRQMSIDRVKKPETGDVGCGEIRKTLRPLPPGSRQLRALGGKDFEKPPHDRDQMFIRTIIDQRRNNVRVKLQRTCGRSPDRSDAQYGVSLDRIAFCQYSKIFS